MFLIQCEDDSSYCIVDNHDVICDENTIENGETVTFFWNKKKFSANIIMRSENVELLNKEICKLKKTDICKKKSLTLHNVVASGKRKAVLNKTCRSLDRPNTSSTKKMKLDNISEKKETLRKNKNPKNIKYESSDIESSNTSEEDKENELNSSFSNNKDVKNNIKQREITNCSPTKEELQEIAKKYYELLKKQSTTNFNTSSIDAMKDNCQLFENKEYLKDENNEEKLSVIDLYLSDNNKVIDPDNDDQLLGHDYSDDKEVHIASHIARKLLEGVFKQEVFMKCTFTGQSPRSLGKERQTEEVFCLHNRAENAIIYFSIDVAEQRGWEKLTKEKVKQVMSQKLGELKRDKQNANKEKEK